MARITTTIANIFRSTEINSDRRDAMRDEILANNPKADLAFADAAYKIISGDRPFDTEPSRLKRIKKSFKERLTPRGWRNGTAGPQFPEIERKNGFREIFTMAPNADPAKKPLERTPRELRLHVLLEKAHAEAQPVDPTPADNAPDNNSTDSNSGAAANRGNLPDSASNISSAASDASQDSGLASDGADPHIAPAGAFADSRESPAQPAASGSGNGTSYPGASAEPETPSSSSARQSTDGAGVQSNDPHVVRDGGVAGGNAASPSGPQSAGVAGGNAQPALGPIAEAEAIATAADAAAAAATAEADSGDAEAVSAIRHAQEAAAKAAEADVAKQLRIEISEALKTKATQTSRVAAFARTRADAVREAQGRRTDLVESRGQASTAAGVVEVTRLRAEAARAALASAQSNARTAATTVTANEVAAEQSDIRLRGANEDHRLAEAVLRQVQPDPKPFAEQLRERIARGNLNRSNSSTAGGVPASARPQAFANTNAEPPQGGPVFDNVAGFANFQPETYASGEAPSAHDNHSTDASGNRPPGSTGPASPPIPASQRPAGMPSPTMAEQIQQLRNDSPNSGRSVHGHYIDITSDEESD